MQLNLPVLNNCYVKPISNFTITLEILTRPKVHRSISAAMRAASKSKPVKRRATVVINGKIFRSLIPAAALVNSRSFKKWLAANAPGAEWKGSTKDLTDLTWDLMRTPQA